MTHKKYSTIIFDFFDTVVNFNPNKLPTVNIDGTTIRSTSDVVYKVFQKSYKHIDFWEFYEAFIGSYKEFEERKKVEDREYPTRDRFYLMFEKLNVGIEEDAERIIEDLVLAHMGKLSSAVEFPEGNLGVIQSLEERYRLAIVSNFDHAPTIYGILEKYEIKNYFEEILISVEVGWRKPNRRIFERAFNLLDIKPQEAICVGDNPQTDIVGSKSVGMDVIWINRNKNRENLPVAQGIPKPDYEVSEFKEIVGIL